MDPLVLLKSAIAAGTPPVLLSSTDPQSAPVPDIRNAQALCFPPSLTFSLDTPTRFANAARKPFSLATVYFAWLLKDANVAEYIAQSSDREIENLSFLEKTDLIAWLEGAPHSDHILSLQDHSPPDLPHKKAPAQKSPKDSALLKIYSHERPVTTRSSLLHGQKAVDFSYVQTIAKESISKSRNKKPPQIQNTLPVQKKPSRNRDPIIILSPSASALITMHNVKSFLEHGNFIPPNIAAQNAGGGRAPDFLAISRKSPRFPDRGMRFTVVDDVEKFKPEYWDRVVCVFTTGQAWQFRTYKWSEPRELFQKVKGVFVQYAGDPQHSAAKDWNVQTIQIERNRRHTDRQVISQFWDHLEAWMESQWSQWPGKQIAARK
ncbi:Cell division control protein 73 [Neolecta irregularis DAH-3]|uniref:Cell division control protein 73 n=1 Tax=Neolecta irregularis (strain DAH-3) TaxID=1198029 RepID=A0A1U7LNL6_NEOID|nr:Cell division control protein 73 [Neolecta irregularis DAH-3]|eukprot:OLL24183.1 Cell division control protein 73 [Neolecta irregularis DAH-3]